MAVWKRSLNSALAAALSLSATVGLAPRATAQTAAAKTRQASAAPADLDAKLAAIEKAVEEKRQALEAWGQSVTELYRGKSLQNDHALQAKV